MPMLAGKDYVRWLPTLGLPQGLRDWRDFHVDNGAFLDHLCFCLPSDSIGTIHPYLSAMIVVSNKLLISVIPQWGNLGARLLRFFGPQENWALVPTWCQHTMTHHDPR
jgi:hypothetical protein